MEVKPNYKETETGVIPEEWAALPARDIGTFKGGSGFPLTAQGEGMGAYPFFKVSDMNNEGNGTFMITANHYVSEATRKRLGATAFPTGTIVFAKVGAAVFLERKKVLAQPSCIDNNMAAFVLDKTRADVRYLHLLLLGKKLGTLVATTALPALNGKQLGEMILAIPPLPEQRAIAAALSDVDALLGGLDRLIAKKRDLKQAAMQQLLTGQTRLPGFSGAWEVKRLGDHVTFLRNGVNSRAELLPEGRVKYLHYGDIHSSAESFLSPQTLPSLPDVKAARLDRLRDGDVIFADASEDIAGVCKSVELRGAREIEVVSGLHTIAARFAKTVLADGFKGFLQHCPPFAIHLRRLAAGTKVYATNRAHIASVEMRLPSLAEQTAIAAVLSDMDAELSALEARRAKTHALKQAMMQELLTGRTRLASEGAADA